MKEEALLPDVSECISKFKLTFKNVIDSEIEALFVDTIIKFHKKGDYIYNEGARIKGCYFLFSGIVKIFQTGVAGKDQIIRFGKEGDIFGFRSVIRNEAADTGRYAVGNVRVRLAVTVKMDTLRRKTRGQRGIQLPGGHDIHAHALLRHNAVDLLEGRRLAGIQR